MWIVCIGIDKDTIGGEPRRKLEDRRKMKSLRDDHNEKHIQRKVVINH